MEQQLLTLNTTVSTMGGAVNELSGKLTDTYYYYTGTTSGDKAVTFQIPGNKGIWGCGTFFCNVNGTGNAMYHISCSNGVITSESVFPSGEGLVEFTSTSNTITATTTGHSFRDAILIWA